MKLLIIGCPHSGTMFTAAVLRSAGVSCGHEAVYTLWGYKEGADTAVAEVSWEAVFHLDREVPAGAVIAHQTRDPIAWLDSWTRMSEHAGVEAWAFLESHCPGISEDHRRDPIRASMRLWVEMNRRCEQHAARRHRVEDLRGDAGAAILGDLCRAAAVAVDLARVRTALEATDRRINHHPGLPSHVRATWESLPPGAELSAFKGLAEAYGYVPP